MYQNAQVWPVVDHDGCNYCGSDFVVGDRYRTHHRGKAIHERCYVETRATMTPKKIRDAAPFYSTAIYTYEEK
jgi:hypothetical protein